MTPLLKFRLKCFALTSAFSVASAGGVAAQELWQGARVGQSAAEISKIFPDAHPIQPINPGSEYLRIDNRSIGDDIARVTFILQSDALQTVILGFDAAEERSRAENRIATARLRDLLSLKYGPPFTCTGSPSDTVAAVRCGWVSGRIQITLNYFDVGGSRGSLAITYKAGPDPSTGL